MLDRDACLRLVVLSAFAVVVTLPSIWVALAPPHIDREPVRVTRATNDLERWVLGEPMELNRATAEALSMLPSIGPKVASRIVAQRGKTGPFRALDELDAVRGIGPRALAELQASVVCDGVPCAEPTRAPKARRAKRAKKAR